MRVAREIIDKKLESNEQVNGRKVIDITEISKSNSLPITLTKKVTVTLKPCLLAGEQSDTWRILLCKDRKSRHY